MDQKEQLIPASPPRRPPQLGQPNMPQQPSIAPQDSKGPAGVPTIQTQHQPTHATNLPPEALQQPLGANNIPNTASIPAVAPQPLLEKPLEPVDKVIDSKDTVDSQAPIKAKQILQPKSSGLSNEASDTPQIQYNSGKLEGQQSQEEQEPEIDPETEFASWTASEFIAHEKPSYWHFAVIGVSILIAAVIFAFTREILSVLVVIVLGAVFAIYGSAKPKTVQYRLTGEGVYTDEKLHKYNDFKSFSMIETAGLPFIQLMSRKRFMVPLTLYTEPKSIDNITEIIGRHVPYDQKQQDPVDKLSAKLKF